MDETRKTVAVRSRRHSLIHLHLERFDLPKKEESMSISFARRGWLAVLLVTLLIATTLPFASSASNSSAGLVVRKNNQEYSLSAEGLGTFHRTSRQVQNARLIEVANSRTHLALWEERRADGSAVPFYAISLDGQTVASVQETSYDILLRYSKFDPAVQRPSVPLNLRAGAPGADGVYIVQFVTQPLEAFTKEIEARGGIVYNFLANHSYLVQMDAQARTAVEALPFVRWVGEFEPAYRLEEFLVERLTQDASSLPRMRYSIMMVERGPAKQNAVAGRISAMGGKVEELVPEGFRIEATLTADQLLAVAKMNEVLFIDRWGLPSTDMDIVRNTGGANFIQSTLGYTGEGVRAEVMDVGVLTTHQDFQARPLIIHGSVTVNNHGTATTGIVFGSGTGNAQAKGLIPGAQGLVSNNLSGSARYTHTAQLSQAPWNAVFQSNSWGNPQTVSYTTVSAELDDMLFLNDVCILQSQSNTGNQTSRPEAWAKNIVSIGGVNHMNTATEADDTTSGASFGPAADGRIKPDLAHYYDNVFTTYTTSTTGYGTFSGTSGATPIAAGHFGIFFQMWHNGLFGNTPGATVFESRPHMTTTKAIMINTAHQWNPVGVSAGLTRVRQGWGRPDLENLYNMRNKMFVVNETDVLTNLGTRSYSLTVPAGSTDPLKATLVYADPKGIPASTQHRINDVTLKVTSPTGTIYYGNNGLSGTSQWSTSGGTPNQIDTVENVYIQSPAAGTWTVEVIASQVVQDAHTETPAMDVDYALVVTGVNRPPSGRTPFDFDGDGKADTSVFRPTDGNWYVLRSGNNSMQAQNWGLGTDTIAPADYDGDGKTDFAVYRPGPTGNWYILQSTDGTVRSQPWQINGLLMPRDYDGDGKDDIATFNTNTGGWHILQSTTNSVVLQSWGAVGDFPAAADFDGDGKADLAIFRPSTGTWYILKSTDGTIIVQAFGTNGDRPVPAKYDADNKADLAVFRPSSNVWYMLNSSNGALVTQPWGASGDRPVAADYDGDGKTDVSVFRPTDGNWYILQSTNNGLRVQPWGSNGDVAVPSAYIP
jgi:hypothetical protein